MKTTLFAAAGLFAAAFAAPAVAAPLLPANPASDAASLVTEVQGYRYHRQCYWTGSGWGYKHGGKVLVCRPYKPSGAGWYWHNEGGRHGWYHRNHKRWHHKW